MYSFHLFLISSAFTRSLPFLSFIVIIFGHNAPLMFPVFLKTSLVFPLLLFSCVIKLCSLKKAFLSLLPILQISVFNLMYLSLSPLFFTSFCSAIQKASSDNHFAFLLFFFFGMVCLPPPAQYYVPLSIVLQAHCYLDLVPWIYLLSLLQIHTGFDLSHNWLASVFHGFL